MFPKPSSRRAVALALGLALSFPAAAKDPAAVEFDPSRPTAEVAAALLKVGDPRALQGIGRVAIAAFNVEFVVTGAASSQVRPIGASASTGLNVAYALKGVGPADMQAIADRLNDDFARDLAAAGIEVIPDESVRAAAAWAKLAGGGQASPVSRSDRASSSIVVGARGRPVFGLAAASTGNPLGALSGFAGALSGAFGIADLVAELKAPVITVDMKVDFVELTSSSSSWLGRTSDTASVAARTALTLVRAQATVANVGAGTSIDLVQPLVLKGDAIVQVRDVSSVAANVGLAALSFAIGKGGTQQVRDKEVIADPARFREVADANLGAVRAMMVERLKAAR